MQRFRFLLKGRETIIDLIHEDQPSLVMLTPFKGHTITALLSQGFLGHILRDLHPLYFHGDIIQEHWISIKFGREISFHIPGALTHDDPKSLTSRHLVKNLQSALSVAPGKV